MKNNVMTARLERMAQSEDRAKTTELWKIEIRGREHYGVMIEDASGEDLALVGKNEARSMRFFERAVEGELSSLHLSEAAQDFRMEYELEIF